MIDNVHPIRSGRGIQEVQVWEAADQLLQEGLRPTIERVRQKIGSGSPNTVSPMLERWFATLGKRLEGRGASLEDGEAQRLPLVVVQAAQHIWEVARREADQVQLQKTEATRREFDLERESFIQKEADLLQRESAFQQARSKLDEALASSRQAIEVMQAQMQAHQQESARILNDSEAEMRRLRKALDDAAASKEALREKAAMELEIKRRALEEAEERHVAQERRLLSEIDRERMATRQSASELDKERKARATEGEAARIAQDAAREELEGAKALHRDAATAWSRQDQETQLELVTLRERAAAAERRIGDLTVESQRTREQSEREIAQLRDSHSSAVAALRGFEARAGLADKAPRNRAAKVSR